MSILQWSDNKAVNLYKSQETIKCMIYMAISMLEVVNIAELIAIEEKEIEIRPKFQPWSSYLALS